jgi:hypothetical protein
LAAAGQHARPSARVRPCVWCRQRAKRGTGTSSTWRHARRLSTDTSARTHQHTHTHAHT